MISIIMPVYRPVFHLLDEAVTSVLSQKEDFELLIIDDGNDKSCANKLDLYGQKDARVRVLHKMNGGVSSARNFGLDRARGSYVTFVDADDVLVLGTFNKAMKVAHETNADVVFGGTEKIYTDGSSLVFSQEDTENTCKFFEGEDLQYVLGAIFDDEALKRFGLKPARYFSVCGTFYKRDVFQHVRFDEDITFCEDSLFNWRALHIASIVAIASGVWYCYKENRQSATGRLRPDILREMEPTAVAFEKLRQQTEGELRRSVDSGIYLYCLYRIYACSILQPRFYRVFRCTKTMLIKKIISTSPYCRLFKEIEPRSHKAALIVALAKREHAFLITLLITTGNRISHWLACVKHILT